MQHEVGSWVDPGGKLFATDGDMNQGVYDLACI